MLWWTAHIVRLLEIDVENYNLIQLLYFRQATNLWKSLDSQEDVNRLVSLWLLTLYKNVSKQNKTFPTRHAIQNQNKMGDDAARHGHNNIRTKIRTFNYHNQ